VQEKIGLIEHAFRYGHRNEKAPYRESIGLSGDEMKLKQILDLSSA
jgi:hypothetical protein